LAEQKASQQAQESERQKPINAAFDTAKQSLEDTLRKKGLSDQDLAEIYRSVANGDEPIPTAFPDENTGVPVSNSDKTMIPTSQFVFNKFGIDPNTPLAQHPTENRPITAQEVLEDLAQDRTSRGAPSTPKIPQINSQKEYDALPSGAIYMDSHGNTVRKK
jgi:hypothetical protein